MLTFPASSPCRVEALTKECTCKGITCNSGKQYVHIFVLQADTYLLKLALHCRSFNVDLLFYETQIKVGCPSFRLSPELQETPSSFHHAPRQQHRSLASNLMTTSSKKQCLNMDIVIATVANGTCNCYNREREKATNLLLNR